MPDISEELSDINYCVKSKGKMYPTAGHESPEGGGGSGIAVLFH